MLRELYVRKNRLSRLEEVAYLKGLPRLQVLWLAENEAAVVNAGCYRQFVLRQLPNLSKLDNEDVGEAEVRASLAAAAGSADLPAALRRLEALAAELERLQREEDEEERFTGLMQRAASAGDLVAVAAAAGGAAASPLLGGGRRSPSPLAGSPGRGRTPAPGSPSRVATPSPGLGHRPLMITPPRQNESGDHLGGAGAGITTRLAAMTQPKGVNGTAGGTGSNSNILNAVLALLQELDEDALGIVQLRCQQLVKNRK
mmetsp:Transcript_30366/g.52494  ORF Transcript_30366/g.52494 Transcript_30366/m.52494 type:complete len:257 (+) Transcript_30366:654-1424(+)